MKYFKINAALPDKMKTDLVEFARSNESKYYNHNSTISSAYTNLNFLLEAHPHYDEILNLLPVRPYHTAILNIKPFATISPHTDGINLHRHTVVIFPLYPNKKNYIMAISDGEKLPYMDCYAFNTQIMHWFINNQYERFSVQLFYDTPTEKLYDELSKSGLC